MWVVYENQEQGVSPQFWEERLSKLFQIPGDRFLKLLTNLWLGRFLIENTPREGWVLDAGCGSGFASRLLHQRRVKIVGIDYAFGLIKACQQAHGGSKFICGDLRTLPLKSASMDAVLSLSSLEHVEVGLETALRELNRVLKKDGTFILIAPRPNFHDALYSRVASTFGVTAGGTILTATGDKLWRNENGFHETADSGFHAYWLTSQEWLEACRRNGFRLVKQENGDLAGGLIRSKIFGRRIKNIHQGLIKDWLMGQSENSSEKLYERLIFERAPGGVTKGVLFMLKFFYSYLNGMVFQKMEEIPRP